MSPLPPTSPLRQRHRGAATFWVVAAGAFLVLAGGGAWLLLAGVGKNSSDQDVQLATIKRTPFVHFVTETGEIESSSNVEVRCEVKSYGGAGQQIIEVKEEGALVKKGDLLVRLDSTALENDLVSKEIVANTSKAAMIEARNVYETAKIAKTEYLEGTYKQETLTIQNEIFVAEEDLRRAAEYLKYSERLASKGYVTPLQLEADRFAVEKAKGDVAAAENKLHVLTTYTKQKMITQLDNDILTAEARWLSTKNSYELDLRNVEELKEEIKKCTIHAPADGQVVHANERSRRGGTDVVIEPGAQVRQGQILIRLPDASRMQVKAKINESRIDLVEEGDPATIRIGAFPDLELPGEVVKVNEYPEPGNFFSTNVKTYATTVRIFGSHEKLRPGLTAEVSIEVERTKGPVPQAPVQSVFEHGGKHFCLVTPPGAWKPQVRQVDLGPSNETMVVIAGGLDKGEMVAVNPRRYLHLVQLPELAPVQIAQADKPTEKTRESGGDQPANGDRDESQQRPTDGEPPRSPGGFFAAMDTNKDGRLTQEEVGAERWGRISAADANGDGAVDRTELSTAMAKFRGGG